MPCGKRIPGTTTITGRFKDSGGLLWWAFEQGKAAERGEINSLYDRRDTAGQLGTGVHHLVYRHVHGLQPLDLHKIECIDTPDGEIPLDDDARQSIQSAFDAYVRWERMTRLRVVRQEMNLVDTVYEFGGTPDAVGTMDGELCLLDWKSSSSIYSDMLCQISAYGYLCQFGLQMRKDFERMDCAITGGFHLCRFSKDHGDFSHHYFPELDLAFEQFLLFRKAYENDKVLRRRAK